MSTTLKLSGIKTFMSGLLFHINLNRGDVIRVSDEVAGKIGGMHRMSDSSEGTKIFYFESVSDETPLTYDFTDPMVLAQAAQRAGDSEFMKRTAAKAAEEPSPVEDKPAAAPAPEPLFDSLPGDENAGGDAGGDADPEPEAPTAPAKEAEAAAAATSAEQPAPVAVAARKRAAQRATPAKK